MHLILSFKYHVFNARGWEVQGGARNVIPLIVHITHFYYYKRFWHLVQN